MEEAHQKFVIMTCAYNADKWIGKCMNSVRNQIYRNYVHVVVDDASTDNTYREMLIHEHSRTRLFQNDKNVKWIRNALMYLDEHILSDEDVVVILDGDDWLLHNDVLDWLRQIYTLSDTWMTYSLFEYPDGRDSSWIPKYNTEILKSRDFRRVTWSFTHLRTFKAFLWDNLNKNDLRGPDGKFTPYTYDQALLFPMLEMCPYGKIKFIDNPMYVYNTDNPLQVEKYDKVKQQALGRWFRSKPKYDILER
jgi:glycosyltransferase involved in cell wall biosynthesis